MAGKFSQEVSTLILVMVLNFPASSMSDTTLPDQTLQPYVCPYPCLPPPIATSNCPPPPSPPPPPVSLPPPIATSNCPPPPSPPVSLLPPSGAAYYPPPSEYYSPPSGYLPYYPPPGYVNYYAPPPPGPILPYFPYYYYAPPPPDPILPYFPFYFKQPPLPPNFSSATGLKRSTVRIPRLILIVVFSFCF